MKVCGKKRMLTLGVTFAIGLAFLVACSPKKSQLQETYGITGTEKTQLFCVSGDEIIEKLNEQIGHDSTTTLSSLDSENNHDNRMFTINGETWKILIDSFTAYDANLSWFKKYSDASSWVGYIKKITLSVYSNSEETAKLNGEYIRALLNIFTPGAEEGVEDALGIYGAPKTEAVITDGTTRVSVGNVVYTYVSGEKFMVEPHMVDWPKESKAPNVIRPE